MENKQLYSPLDVYHTREGPVLVNKKTGSAINLGFSPVSGRKTDYEGAPGVTVEQVRQWIKQALR